MSLKIDRTRLLETTWHLRVNWGRKSTPDRFVCCLLPANLGDIFSPARLRDELPWAFVHHFSTAPEVKRGHIMCLILGDGQKMLDIVETLGSDLASCKMSSTVHPKYCPRQQYFHGGSKGSCQGVCHAEQFSYFRLMCFFVVFSCFFSCIHSILLSDSWITSRWFFGHHRNAASLACRS